MVEQHCPKVPPPQPVSTVPPPPPPTDFIPYHAPESLAPVRLPEGPGSATAPAAGNVPDLTSNAQLETASDDPDPSELAPVGNMLSAALQRGSSSNQPSSSVTLTTQEGPSKIDTKKGRAALKDWREIERPVPSVDIGPRWCRFCEINKPDRTHHCRHCGTCVMQFDRTYDISTWTMSDFHADHCPWIGQCVGYRNHKVRKRHRDNTTS